MNDLGLAARARRHAALGDPSRLRMLDLLSLGDLSPTRLREELGLSSNLLAHHLGVLEREGLIARIRSEGDRRRSYVKLVPEALAELGSSTTVGARRVLFVCSANAARSQLARALWASVSEVPAESAGTHPGARIAPGAVAVAKRHGLDLGDAAPRAVEDTVRDDDFIVTVCDRAHEELAGGSVHWSVPDPTRGGGLRAFESAFSDLDRRISGLAPRVLAVA